MNKQVLEALDAAGEALKATGERSIILGCHDWAEYGAEGQYRYTVRLELEGTSGIHGGGNSPADAYREACGAREAKIRELEVQRRVDAEVRRQLAEEQRAA